MRWLQDKEHKRDLNKDMAAFALSTGLRQSNVSYLRWDQVDTARGMAWIHADQSKSRKAIAVPLIEGTILAQPENKDGLRLTVSR